MECQTPDPGTPAEIDPEKNNEASGNQIGHHREREGSKQNTRSKKAKEKDRKKYYNSRVRGTSFKPGDMVYRSNEASHARTKANLDQWEGPYEGRRATQGTAEDEQLQEDLPKGQFHFLKSYLPLSRIIALSSLQDCSHAAGSGFSNSMLCASTNSSIAYHNHSLDRRNQVPWLSSQAAGKYKGRLMYEAWIQEGDVSELTMRDLSDWDGAGDGRVSKGICVPQDGWNSEHPETRSNVLYFQATSLALPLFGPQPLTPSGVWDEKQIKPWNLPELLFQLSNDSQTIAEILKQREEKRIEREQAANLAVQKEQEEQAAQSFTPYWNFPMIDDDDDEYTI
ncbi:hypothetical protein Tco_0020481 [Tanacetum coccineum]